MNRLAEILELVHSADRRWNSISAAGIQANDKDLGDLVRKRVTAKESPTPEARTRSRGFSSVFGPSRPRKVKSVKIGTDRWRVWLQAQDWSKQEMTRGRHRWATITKGETWWAWQGTGPVTSNFGGRGVHGGQPITRALALLRPASLLPHLELSYVSKGSYLGRDTYRLRGRVINSHLMLLGNFGLAGDQCRLVIDSERGVALSLECQNDGTRLLRTKVSQIDFDRDLDAKIFEPPGDAVHPSDVGISHFPALSGLPARVPHPVFVPVGIEFDVSQHPFLFRPTASVDEGDREVDRRPSVSITYQVLSAGRPGALWINESAEPFVRDEDKEWDSVNGIRVRIGGAGTQVRFVKSDVYIHMESDVCPLDELVSLAESLEVIPNEPPRLAPNG